MCDFLFADHGSLAILTPLTRAARVWVDAYLPDDALRLGGGVAIEPRYIGAILDGLLDDGLTVGA